MNISQAAQKVGLPVKTVRYYADIALAPAAARNAAGYRQYDEKTVRKLNFVKRARDFGFSIPECRDLLNLYEDKSRSSADVRAIAQLRLKEIEAKQEELELLRRELGNLVTACKGDARPDCPILDYLC